MKENLFYFCYVKLKVFAEGVVEGEEKEETMTLFSSPSALLLPRNNYHVTLVTDLRNEDSFPFATLELFTC